MILRVRGDENPLIFDPGGDFFDVRKSTRILHRFLRAKVRKVAHFGSILGACGRHFGDFFDDFFEVEKKSMKPIST